MAHDPRFLATAIDIVLRAGAIQLRHFRQDIHVEKKGTIDLVTDVDLEVEDMCRRVLAGRFPAHAVLAEEHAAGDASTGDAEHCWVFDPVDGTTNYAHGIPVFCAALALEIQGRATVAAIYDPTRRELFTAERGQGAYLNGTRMAVSRTARLIDAVLATGFPYDVHQHGEAILARFGAFVTRARAVRRFGSAALDLAYVAAGRLDGFWEQRLRPWDIAAGSLLIEEAGGVVTGMDGSPFHARIGHVLATGPALHGAMLDVVRTVKG